MSGEIKFNPKIFGMDYSAETRVIYEILVFHEGKISPKNLVEMVSNLTTDNIEEVCRYALWALYRDGFIDLNILTHEIIDAVNRNEV